MSRPSNAAEQSRHGFLGNLFAGSLRWDRMAPFPRQAADERANGDRVVEAVQSLLRAIVDPDAVEETGHLPEALVPRLRAANLLNLGLDAESGGRGLSYFDVFRAVQAAMSWSLPAGYVIAVHNGIGAGAVLVTVPEGKTKERVRAALRAGAVSGWADTEVTGAGNRMPATEATPVEGGGYAVSGEKLFTVNGSLANLLNVSATLRRDGADASHVLFVDTNAPGFRVTHVHELMGLRGLPIAAMTFDGVRVPAEALLAGDEGHWRDSALLEPLSALGRMYIVVAASLATAKSCLGWSREFLRRRRVDGRPLLELEAVQRLATANAADVFAMDSVARFCLVGIGEDQLALRWFEQVAAKNLASMLCANVVDRTMSLFAAEGYETARSKRRRGGAPPFPVERAYRDARAFRIAGGVEFLIDFAAARTALLAVHDTGAPPTDGPEPDVDALAPALSPSNRAHLRAVADGARRLGRAGRALRARFPDAERLEVHQHALIVLNRIAGDLFAMAATLGRAADPTPDEPNAGDLADVFCDAAALRIEAAFRELERPDGPDHRRIARAWLDADAADFLLQP